MKTKIYGALVIVFVSGLGLGFFLGQYVDRARMHHLMQRGPERVDRMITGRLARHLDLDEAQEREVRAKVAIALKEVELDFRRHGEVMRERMTKLFLEIRPLLNAAQQKILDRMDADDLRPGPPPPPPDRRGPDWRP